MKKFSACLLLVFLIIALDQVTKSLIQSHFYIGETVPVIKNLFSLTYVTNKGAAFGMLAHANDWIRRLLFLLVPVVACLWFVWLIWQARNKYLIQQLSYSLILAGAIGNLIDRFYLGFVVDFFDFYWGDNHFPAFNVADSSITIAAALLIIEALYLTKKKITHAPSTIDKK